LASDRKIVSNEECLLSPTQREDGGRDLRKVKFFRDELDRISWMSLEGENKGTVYTKGYFHPLMHNNENTPQTLLRSMDYTGVDLGVLTVYPTVVGRDHGYYRRIVQKFPDRFRRLICHKANVVLPQPNSPSSFSFFENLEESIEELRQEIAFGGVAGFQFFTGWYYNVGNTKPWDCEEMKPFWDAIASLGVPVYFTLGLGMAGQYAEEGNRRYLEEQDILTRWMQKYNNVSVVLTHGLPWRNYINDNKIQFPEKIWEPFKNEKCHLQMLIPLRIGDIWKYPWKEVDPLIEEMLLKVGSKQMLYGTDMPIVERFCTYLQTKEQFSLNSLLSEEEKSDILGGNAYRLIQEAEKASPITHLIHKKQPTLNVSSLSFSSMDGVGFQQQYKIPKTLPAEKGMKLEDIETPSLIVDLDKMESNIQKMSGLLKNYPHMKPRPHSKVHKCGAIARAQLSLMGATGMTAQTVAEAEEMVSAGVADILITNMLVTPSKIERALNLSLFGGARVTVLVDNVDNTMMLAKAATKRGTTLQARVELCVGTGRCGFEDPKEAAELCSAIYHGKFPGLQLDGLQAYHGVAQSVRVFQERKDKILEAAEKVGKTLEYITKFGVPSDSITVGGGGTGTFLFECDTRLWNETQVGSYIFGDGCYSKNLDEDGKEYGERQWQQALFVLTSVISTNQQQQQQEQVGGGQKRKMVVDAGLKGISTDKGFGRVYSEPDAEVGTFADEHSIVLSSREPPHPLASKLLLVPSHCDPTVALHDFFVAVRGGVVDAVWPIARGH